MRVKLKSNWFTPKRRLYPAGEYDFPERFKDILPSSAEYLEDAEPEDGHEEVEPDWKEEANGVSVSEGKNGWYTLSYTEGEEAKQEKVQGEDDARKRAEELRA